MDYKISLIGSNRVSAEEGEENVTYPNAAHCARVCTCVADGSVKRMSYYRAKSELRIGHDVPLL